MFFLRMGLISIIALGLAGCGLTKRAVPPGFNPLDPTNQATFPSSATDPHPETLNVVKGHDSKNNYDWADGEGYVHASLKDVWSALQDGDVVADRRELTSWKVTATNTVPDTDVSFTLSCVTKQLSLTYIVGWKEEATEGTLNEPTEVVVRGDLIQSASVLGMDVMALLSDSIVLSEVDANTTSFAMIRHRDTLSSSPEAAAQFVQDVYANVVAKVHSMPLPTLN